MTDYTLKPPPNRAILYYSHNVNPRVAVAVAKHLNSPVAFVLASPRDPLEREAFSLLNPNALVPVLKHHDGVLWETDAIACHLSHLAGSNFWRLNQQMPEMVKWISWATHHLNRHAEVLVWFRVTLPKFSDEAPDLHAIEEALGGFREAGEILDRELRDKEWLVGGELSYADFRVATFLPFADQAGLPLEEMPHVARWHNQLMKLAAWRDPFSAL